MDAHIGTMTSAITPSVVVGKYSILSSYLETLEERSPSMAAPAKELNGLDRFMEWIDDGHTGSKEVTDAMDTIYEALLQAHFWANFLESNNFESESSRQKLLAVLQQANQVARKACPSAYGGAPASPPPPPRSESTRCDEEEESSICTNEDAPEIVPEAQALYDEGLAYYQGDENQPRSFAQAAAKFTQAAELGHPLAQKILGDMYLYGKGVKQNYEKALAYYTSAAQVGNPGACFNIASLFYNGGVTERLPDQALAWYQLAANSRFTRAQLAAASLSMLGVGTPENQPKLAEAVTYLRRAAHANNANAQFALAICYDLGLGVAAHARRSFAWLLRAARNGHLEAQYKVGATFMDPNSDAVVVNHAYALVWLTKAAEQGHVEAQFKLGQLYSMDNSQYEIPEPVAAGGESVPVPPPPPPAPPADDSDTTTEPSDAVPHSDSEFPVESPIVQSTVEYVQPAQDLAKAREWYQQASDAGHKIAQFELAKLLIKDETASSVQIDELLMASAKAGYAPAQYLWAHRATGGFNINYAEHAFPWLKLSADAAYVPALLKLTEWIENEVVDVDDIPDVKILYRAAAVQGDPTAIAYLESHPDPVDEYATANGSNDVEDLEITIRGSDQPVVSAMSDDATPPPPPPPVENVVSIEHAQKLSDYDSEDDEPAVPPPPEDDAEELPPPPPPQDDAELEEPGQEGEISLPPPPQDDEVPELPPPPPDEGDFPPPPPGAGF